MNEHDTTVTGGRYIQNGTVVDSEGKAVEGLTVTKDGEIVEDKKQPTAKDGDK